MIEKPLPLRTERQEKYIKAYLFTYNLLQSFGWTFLLLQILQYYTISSIDAISLYDHVKLTLIIVQNAAILEVVHSAIKFVNSNPAITFQQISSRVMIVCGILIPTSDARNSIGLPCLLFAWSITEIIRYSNYTLNVVNKVPYFLTWLRYSTFIVLYPVGVTGELLCSYAAQIEVSKTRLWSADFPNKWNYIFYYDYYIIFFMFLYIPLFPQMFLHMVAQRKKILGDSEKKVK